MYEYWGTRGIKNQDEGRYVRTIYNSNVIDMPCSNKTNEYCTLSEFRKMMDPLRSINYKEECKMEGTVITLPGMSPVKVVEKPSSE